MTSCPRQIDDSSCGKGPKSILRKPVETLASELPFHLCEKLWIKSQHSEEGYNSILLVLYPHGISKRDAKSEA